MDTNRVNLVRIAQYKSETSKPQYKYLYNRIEVLRIVQRLVDIVLDGWECIISKDVLMDQGHTIMGICVEHLKYVIFAGDVFLSRDWLDTVTHEIAHALTPNDHTHGPEFRRAYDLLSAAPVYEYEFGDALDRRAYIVLKNTNRDAKRGEIPTTPSGYVNVYWYEERAQQIDKALAALDLLDFIETLRGLNDLVFVYDGEFMLMKRSDAPPTLQHFEIIYHEKYSVMQFDAQADTYDDAPSDNAQDDSPSDNAYVVRARLGIELSPNVDDLSEVYVDRVAEAGLSASADVEPLPLDWEMSEANEANEATEVNRNLRKR